MAIAIFDRALPYEILARCASLYPTAIRPDGCQYFGGRWFISWVVFGVYGSACLTLVALAAISAGATDVRSGRTSFDWAAYGQCVFSLVVFVSIFATIPFTHTIFWFTLVGFLLCIISLYSLWAALNNWALSALKGSFSILHRNPRYHLMMIFGAVTPLMTLTIWWRYRVSNIQETSKKICTKGNIQSTAVGDNPGKTEERRFRRCTCTKSTWRFSGRCTEVY